MLKSLILTVFIWLACWHGAVLANSTGIQEIRVGVLVSGSVHWEVETLVKRGFDKQNNIHVKTIPLGSVNALLVALQGGAVDIIVSDWTWVANQYWRQRYFKFYPFSMATGGIIAKRGLLNSVADLKGKRLGVAGGPEGKSWLVFKAYVEQKYGIDIEKQSTVKFAAPPIVNALIRGDKVDAGLNFWHFNALLEGGQYHTQLSVSTMLEELDVKVSIPMLGWVFSEKWANENAAAVDRFLQASQQAKRLLKTSDEAWKPLRKLMKVKQQDKFERLREGFRSGIPEQFGVAEIEGIKITNRLLHQQYQLIESSKASSAEFPESVFWRIGDPSNASKESTTSR